MLSRLRPWLLGALAGFAAGAFLGSASLTGAVAGRQGSDHADLEARLSALETQLGSVLALAPHLTVVEDTLDGLAGPHILFEGVNVHVRSGSGRTNDLVPVGGALTGLGNLVVGYNEPPPGLAADARRGSHTLIVGEGHRHTSWGGFLAGVQNTVLAPGASVGGGQENTALGFAASVGGGKTNTASGVSASVGGGEDNTASGTSASVGGGANNQATQTFASVSGGRFGTASGTAASVSGGDGNTASNETATVSGGFGNSATGDAATVSGGESRTADGNNEWVAGGLAQPN